MPDDAYRLLIVSVLSGLLGAARDGGASAGDGMQVVTSRVGGEKAIDSWTVYEGRGRVKSNAEGKRVQAIDFQSWPHEDPGGASLVDLWK